MDKRDSFFSWSVVIFLLVIPLPSTLNFSLPIEVKTLMLVIGSALGLSAMGCFLDSNDEEAKDKFWVIGCVLLNIALLGFVWIIESIVGKVNW